MDKNPEEITMMHLEVVVMPQGEIICAGKTMGWVKDLGQYLSQPEGKNRDEISISWHIDDVKYVDGQREDTSIPDLTDDECREVLQRVKKGHDATLGVNWDTLAIYADDVRSERNLHEAKA